MEYHNTILTTQSTFALHIAIVWFPYTHESFILQLIHGYGRLEQGLLSESIHSKSSWCIFEKIN